MLENYPRDELFQIDEDTLYGFALAIMQLDERPRVRVLPRRDRFDRFVSVLVYVPRDRYDSGVRTRSARYLASAYNGRVSAFYPSFPEGPLVRVHFIIARRRRARRRTRTARRWKARSSRSCAPGPTRSPRRSRWCTIRSKAQQLYAPLPRGVPGRLSRSLRAAGRGRRHPAHRKPVADRPLGVDFYSRREGDPPAHRAESVEPRDARSRCPSACRCWRTWASAWWTSAPTRSSRAIPARPRSGCTT